MADNIIAPATGAVLATDEIANTHYPRTKVGYGPDGEYADVSADNPLPVAIVSGGGSGGGGGGDASAANQATEIARLTSILSSVDGVEALLSTISTLLGGTLTIALPTGAATNAGVASALAGVSFYPTTQAVSGSVSLTGTATVAGTVGISGTVAVSGTFWQTTQPISAAALPLPAGAATQATLASLLTQITALLAVGTETYTLANNVTIAAGAAGPTVTVPRGGYFFFDAAFSGTSPSLKLQRLGSDGTTWLDVVTRTATGTGDPVGIPSGSQLRVYNAGANSLTGVSAVLG
ncbi:MAG: hypothetical protein ABW128_00570 [Rhizorhabdus sp.]